MIKKLIFTGLILSAVLSFPMTKSCFADAASALEQAIAYQKDHDFQQAKQIYESVISGYPGTDYAFHAQSNLAIVNVRLDDYNEAESAYNKLLADFPSHPEMSESIYRIARNYRRQNKFNKAVSLFREVIEKYPDSKRAGDARLYLDRINIISLIEQKRFSQAQTAVDKLISDFNSQPELPKTLHDIARKYRDFGKYENAKGLCQYIIQQYPDSKYAGKSRLHIKMLDRYILIISGRYGPADAAVEKMCSDFSGDPDLPRALYNTARAYQRNNLYDKARAVYQKILDDHPQSKPAPKAAVHIEALDILPLVDSGDDDHADILLNSLLSEFAGHPELAAAVCHVAERYHNRAVAAGEVDDQQEAGYCFRKSAETYEIVAKRLPATFSHTPKTYYRAAMCYDQDSVGEYGKAIDYYKQVTENWPDYEYAWNALFMTGRGYEKMKKSGLIDESEADLKTRTAYQKLVEDYPSCAPADYARKWLAK